MTALAARDAERLLRFVAEAERVDGDQPFTEDLLVELGKLVEADWISYCELDRVRRRQLLLIGRPGENDGDEIPDSDRIFWEIVIDQHPVCVQHQRGTFDALKLSDFLSLAQLRRSRLYEIWFRPYGVQRELNVAIPSPLWHTKTFLLDRAGTRDFTERDRLVLDLLQPHLARLWKAARTRRLLRAALAELEQVSENEPRGLIVLSPAGDVEFASPPARRLLREFFGESGSALPPELTRRLEAGTGTLVRRRGPRELRIERSDGALLLHERQVVPDLTAREREVLSWVARGKTNPEIAELLWLAPSTVRKHLENVYAKLGVSTRTAAVARFLGILDAQAS